MEAGKHKTCFPESPSRPAASVSAVLEAILLPHNSTVATYNTLGYMKLTVKLLVCSPIPNRHDQDPPASVLPRWRHARILPGWRWQGPVCRHMGKPRWSGEPITSMRLERHRQGSSNKPFCPGSHATLLD